jgi:DNA topoisomerase-1
MLRNRHLRVKRSHLTFDFRGKRGIKHSIDLQDRRVANVVRR